MINIILGIFIGIFLGILLEKYLFSYLDAMFEMYTYKQAEKATQHQVNAQRIVYDFQREYPEALEQGEQSAQAIGFQYEPEYEYEDEEDDD